jgi:hypothetical protein
MYEITEGKREVGERTIRTWKREVFSANCLEVEAGTNGYKGGDAGHGSRTYLRIADVCCTGIEASLIPGKETNGGIEIALYGDTELKTFIEALEFAVHVLKDESLGGGRL